MNQVGLLTCEIDVTPVITASSAYVANNQVGGIQTLTHACLEQGKTAELKTVTVLDIDAQAAAINILFFNQSPTVTGSDHAAFAMSNANFKSQFIGNVSLAAANYVLSSSGAKSCTLQLTNAFFNTVDPNSHLYAIAVTTGTPTYTTTSSLVFKYVFARHF